MSGSEQADMFFLLFFFSFFKMLFIRVVREKERLSTVSVSGQGSLSFRFPRLFCYEQESEAEANELGSMRGKKEGKRGSTRCHQGSTFDDEPRDACSSS